jgi:hypothetical protein
VRIKAKADVLLAFPLVAAAARPAAHWEPTGEGKGPGKGAPVPASNGVPQGGRQRPRSAADRARPIRRLRGGHAITRSSHLFPRIMG